MPVKTGLAVYTTRGIKRKSLSSFCLLESVLLRTWGLVFVVQKPALLSPLNVPGGRLSKKKTFCLRCDSFSLAYLIEVAFICILIMSGNKDLSS